MDTGVRGLRTVREWLELLREPHSPLNKKLAELYGGNENLISEAAAVCQKALEAFGGSYGWDRKAVIVRATGRINLVGMHIDHRGGAVNPIAIKEVFFIAEPREDDLVLLKNVESDEFPEEGFRISEALPAARRIENWDAWCHDEYEKRKGSPSVTWSNYVRAAVLYLQHMHTRSDGAFDPPLRGMKVMVHGNIPQAAGLSTSSSIVVAAAEACIHLNRLEVSPLEFVESCGYAEWYVGTRGGAGDHTAIKFGKPDAILHTTSFPFTVDSAPFPRDYKIVLANSLVEAKKRAGARDAFNSRVASYVFGLMLARKNFPQYAPKLHHLRDINPRTLGVDEVEIYRILKAMPDSAAREDILRLLPDGEQEVRHTFRSHAEPSGGYAVRQVCMFGVAECIRAEMAPERLRAGDIRGFGELKDLSHDGDRVTRAVDGKRVPVDNGYPDDRIDALIEDLQSGDPVRMERARLWRQPGGYNVSVPEIDMLVDIARAAPGVIGAGIIGAGLGGSMAAIVEERHAGELVENMAREYYQPMGLPVQAEIVAPVGGAGVLDV